MGSHLFIFLLPNIPLEWYRIVASLRVYFLVIKCLLHNYFDLTQRFNLPRGFSYRFVKQLMLYTAGCLLKKILSLKAFFSRRREVRGIECTYIVASYIVIRQCKICRAEGNAQLH